MTAVVDFRELQAPIVQAGMGGPMTALDDGPRSLLDSGPLYAGEGVTRISAVRPARRIVSDLTP